MKRWIPRSLYDDGMIGGDDIPPYALDVKPYVLLSDHEQAMAEKDREIAYLQSERLSAAAMGDQRDRDYHTLMAQAVRFAELAGVKMACQEAYDFLNSPEVREWREQQEGL